MPLYAYVTASTDDALTIIDVTDPANPTFKGVIRGGGAEPWLNAAYGVHVVGNYAYVAVYVDNALTIIDVTDPANPTFKGVIRGGGAEPWLQNPMGVYVVGNYAYVTASVDDALTIIDVTDPANPTFKGVIKGGGGVPWLNGARSVQVVGNYAYVCAPSGVDDALTIIDVTDPANPTFKGVIRGGEGVPWLKDPISVHVVGNYAYVAVYGDNALTIIDVTDPANPTFKGVIRGGGAEPWLFQAGGVYVVGNYAYVTASGDDALVIIDVTDPANPTFKGVIRGGGAEPWLTYANRVKVVGNYAYVAASTDDALVIIDVTDPANPTFKGVIKGGGAEPWLNGAYDVHVVVVVFAPTVTIQAVSGIEANSATGNGNITDNGGEDCGKRGFVYDTSPHGDPGDTAPADSEYAGHVEETDSFGTGAFTGALTSLLPETTYYVRAYAHNSEGYSYSDEVSFTTQALAIPSVSTNPATSVGQTTATKNGTLDDDGGEACDCSFEYGETTDYGKTTAPQSKREGETFSQEVRGLNSGTVYHFRAVATNSAGTSYGEDRTFHTEALSAAAHQALGRHYSLGRHGL